MCHDQQYLAIDPPPERRLLNLSLELPADLVLRFGLFFVFSFLFFLKA